MRDSEIVAAIVARDPDGLAQAYDKYAARLFGFCRSLLGEPADATDAVQDTFVIAAGRLAGLRDPDRLRPWLYAVARHECHRRLEAGAAPATLDEATGRASDSPDTSGLATHAHLRELVRAAILRLSPGDQEVAELSLRHDLHGPDLAGVLGVPGGDAVRLEARARAQLEQELGALLADRAGPDASEERQRREVRPVMQLGFGPLAVIPVSLRARLLELAADPAVATVTERATIIKRAGRFGADGFPAAAAAAPAPALAAAAPAVPDRGRRRWWRADRRAAVIAASAAAVVVAVAVLALVVPQATHPDRAATRTPGAAGTSGHPGATARPAPGQPTTSTSGASSGVAGSLAQQRASRPAHPAPADGTAPGAAAGDVPGAAATSGSGGASPTAGPGTSAPAPAASGPVTVSPSTLVLAGLVGGSASGTLTLSAGSRPVAHYTISIPSSLLGRLTAAPASGSIPAHGRQPVTVTLKGVASVDTTITVNPGGHAVTVLLGVHLSS